MTFPILYSRTSTYSIQTWSIEVSENKFRTISGQIDGKKILSEWTVCTPKNIGRSNETSGSEQALLEAKSKWQKKIDSGYKEDIKDIDITTFTEPMLAKNYDDVDIIFPVACQPKIDKLR